jgi:hypothetical protein
MTRTEADLRAALLAEAETTVDVDVLMTRARARAARRRRRTVAAGVAVAVAAIAAAVPAIVATGRVDRPGATSTGSASVGGPSRAAFTGQCVPRALEFPPGIDATDPLIDGTVGVDAMDSTGRFVVTSFADRDRAPFVIRWDHERPARLDLPEEPLRPTGVNARGTVVGAGSLTAFSLEPRVSIDDYPWVYRDGGYARLPIPPGHVAAGAAAVNDRGDIVGEAFRADGRRVAVLWPADRPEAPRVLTAPRNARALGISNDGTVVGLADGVQPLLGRGDINDLRGRPYAWDATGRGRFLAQPAGYPYAQATEVRGDWAIGSAWHPIGAPGGRTEIESVALRWNLRSGAMTTVDEWDGSLFLAVNAGGDVVVRSVGRGSMLVRGDRAFPLPPLRRDTSGRQRVSPAAVSDDATVVAGRHVGTPGMPIVVWRC